MKYSLYVLLFFCQVASSINAHASFNDRNTFPKPQLLHSYDPAFHSINANYLNFGYSSTEQSAFCKESSLTKPQKVNTNIPLDTCICSKLMKLKDSYDSLPDPKNPSTFSQYYFNKMGCNLTETRITLLQTTCRNSYNHDLASRPKYTWTVSSYEALDAEVLGGPKMDSLNLPGNCSCQSASGIHNPKVHSLFNVFPNNFSQTINILSIGSKGIEHIELMDITGKIIYRELIDLKSNCVINTGNIQSGIYFISIYYLENGVVKSQKFKIVKS